MINFLEVQTWIIIYLLIINIVTFIVFGLDKWKAVHDKWRIPVKTLLGLSLIGGSVGGLLGMYMFRHKTKKLAFTVGIPVMLVLQIGLLVWVKWL